MAKADSPTKLCGEDGCGRPLRARGLCATHYNQQQYAPGERHRRVIAPCGWCGRLLDKRADARFKQRYCSDEHLGNWLAFRAGTLVSHLTKRHPVHPDYVPPLPVLWRPPPVQPPKPSTIRWVAGWCHWCGNAYVAEDYTGTARFCSKKCGKRNTRHNYRARKWNAFVANVSRKAIFERDDWRCQLCKRKVRRDKATPHPLAPVLDHVIPLARGGTHEPANVQCAHFICNSVKSDGGVAEQLMLFG
jgi:hypothetical protein